MHRILFDILCYYGSKELRAAKLYHCFDSFKEFLISFAAIVGI